MTTKLKIVDDGGSLMDERDTETVLYYAGLATVLGENRRPCGVRGEPANRLQVMLMEAEAEALRMGLDCCMRHLKIVHAPDAERQTA